MSETPARSVGRPPRRWRRAAWIAAIVLVSLALIAWAAVWYYRDLPRRQVERALASRLAADVEVGALAIDGLRHFVVSDLVVRRMAGQPRLEELRVATLDVTGSVFEIQQGRFATLRADGASLRLVPSAPDVPPAAEGAAVSASVDRLELVGLRVLLGSGTAADAGGDPAIVVSGTLTGVGGDLAGDLVLSSPAVPIERLIALARGSETSTGPRTGVAGGADPKSESAGLTGPAGWDAASGRLEHFEGRVTIGERGKKIDASASGSRLVLDSAAGPIVLPEPSVEAHVRPSPGGALRIEVWPTLSIAESMSASALYDDAKGRLVSLRAEAHDVDLAPLLAFARILPDGWRVAGRADFEVSGSAPVLAYELEARLPSVEGPVRDGTLAAKDAKVALSGKIALEGAADAMPVRGSVEIASLEGRVEGRDVPKDLAPLRGTLEGVLSRSAANASASSSAIAFTGQLAVDAPAIGRVRVDGRASMDAGAAAGSLVPTGQSGSGGQTGVAPAGAASAGTTLTGTAASGSSGTPGASASGTAMDLRWRWDGVDLDRLTRLAGILGFGLPPGLTATGRGEASGTLTGAIGAPRIAGSLALSAMRIVSEDPTAARRPARPGGDAPGPASHGARAASPSGPHGAASSGAASAWSLSDARLDARFAWTGPAGPIDVASLDLRGRARVGALEPFAASLHAGARVDPFQGSVDVTQATLDATGVARLRASVALRRATTAPVPPTVPVSAQAATATSLDAFRGSAAVHFEAVDLSRLQATLRPLTGDAAAGYAAKGDAQGDLTFTLEAGGALAGTGKAAIGHTGFSSADGSQALEGLDTTWDLALGGNLGDMRAPVTVRASADVSGFQFLWGSVFVDGTKLPSRLELRADLSRSTAAAAAAGGGPPGSGPSVATPRDASVASAEAPWRMTGRADWTFPDGPRLTATATASNGAPLGWTLEAESRDLATTFERFVRAPLGDSIALFRRIEAAGTAHVEARGTWSSDEPTVSGRVRLGGVRISGTEKVVEVSGLDLDLPFDLAWGPPGANGARSLRGAPQLGSVRFGHLAAMGLDVPASSTGLRIRADAIELQEGLAVPLLDGVVGFEQLKLIDLLRPTRHLESAMLVSSVSLASVSKAFALPPLEGSADAHFPRVTLSANALQVDGGGEVRVFGGSVKLGAISGQDILSRYPKLIVSADFSEIDLSKVTHTFDFGEMTGIIKGYVHDCELFRGVPTAFDARVETQETRGVSRTVNVKAIQNLTILGTGTRPSIFDRGIHRFFDKYTYSRIGIAMTLKDDVFVLRGLEHRGDQELFVKGRLPFPINVVNAQPGFPISFQDMIERVKNLDVTAATVQH